MAEDQALPAGSFSDWIVDLRAALRGERDAEVPCNGCTACCTSSQFIHIEPDESDTLAHIPSGLLFPAPRRSPGHVVLGYDENGHCPMLIDDQCSIYEHRPRTCRTYDCRVFAAAGVELDDEDKRAIAERVRRWRFAYPAPIDKITHDAVRAAATRVRAASPTQRAILAVESYEEPLPEDDDRR